MKQSMRWMSVAILGLVVSACGGGGGPAGGGPGMPTPQTQTPTFADAGPIDVLVGETFVG